MKKIFFTAIALVAFTSASMANTNNENTTKNSTSDLELKDSCTNEVVVEAQEICGGVWGSTRIYALNQGFTPDQASCIAFAALIECLGFDKATVTQSVGTLC